MKIFLIGMPGSGKSTVGKQLAEALHLPFVDLDDEITKKIKHTITDVFSKHGETYFREAESEILVEWATSPNDFVMATGGGAPCFHNGIGIINEAGISVFLDIPIAEIVRRLEHEDHRPLLQDGKLQRLEEIRLGRIQTYRQAQLIIPEDKSPVDEVIKYLSTKT